MIQEVLYVHRLPRCCFTVLHCEGERYILFDDIKGERSGDSCVDVGDKGMFSFKWDGYFQYNDISMVIVIEIELLR